MPDEDVSTEQEMPAKADSRQTHGETRVDPGIIGVALAVSGAAAALAAKGSETLIRVVATIAFTLSAIAAADLYWAYLVSKVPDVAAEASQHRGRGLGIHVWLIRRWIGLVRCEFRHLGIMPPEEQMALGLLNLLAAFVFLTIVVGLWIAVSFFH